MPILRKLKSLLGVDDGEDDVERDVTVTVEHDPENEAAVKGADVEESSPSGDGDDTTVATASQADSVATEESEDDADDAGVDSDEADETPDEVEIPDAEEPADETEEESADESDVENAEEDYEVDAESGDSGASEPVDVLNGIGSAYAERLGNAGVDTVADLAAADAADLSEDTDIAEGRIQNWIDQANDY